MKGKVNMVSNKRKDSMEIKLHNRRLIILSILKYGPISRTELAKQLGMTKGGISPIINSLISEGALEEIGVEQTFSGRKPTLLSLKEHYMNVIAVNWGRLAYEVALVTIKGTMMGYIKGDIEKNAQLDDVLQRINQSIYDIENQYKDYPIVGIGVAAPGPISLSTNTILKPPYFNNFSNIKVDKVIGVNLDLPVYLQNDADARAIAERYFGVGKEYNDFIHISVTEGIGASIIINGVQYRNENSFAGEFGHLTISYKGRQCDCGNRGCLEVYSSIRAIKEKASQLEGRKVHWDFIASQVKDGNKEYLKIVKNSIEALGCGLISLVHMFQPESIVIGGTITDIGERIITETINEVITEKSIFRDYYIPKIHLSKVEDASIKGIAMSVFEKTLVKRRGI